MLRYCIVYVLIFLSATLDAMDTLYPKTPWGDELLIEAIKANDLPKVRALIEAGIPIINEQWREKGGVTYDFRLPALKWAAKIGNPAIIRLLIESGALVSIKEVEEGQRMAGIVGVDPQEVWYGKTALILAASAGHTACVQELLTAKSDINQVDWNGSTALSKAAKHGHLDCVHLLIGANADIQCCEKNDCYVVSPLIEAILGGNAACVHELIAAKAEANCTIHTRSYALAIAVNGGNLDCVRELIAANTDVENLSFPLERAASLNNVACVRELIAAKADVNKGYYLHRALMNSSPDCLPELIKARADVNCVDQQGATPLFWAARHCPGTIVQALICAGARKNDGSALDDAIKHRQKENVEILIENMLTLPNENQKRSIIIFLGIMKHKLSSSKKYPFANEAYRQRCTLFKNLFLDGIYVQNKNNFGASIPGQQMAKLPDSFFKKQLVEKYSKKSDLCSVQ